MSNPASTNDANDLTRWPRVCESCQRAFTAEQYEQLPLVDGEQLWCCWWWERRCKCGELISARTRGQTAAEDTRMQQLVLFGAKP